MHLLCQGERYFGTAVGILIEVEVICRVAARVLQCFSTVGCVALPAIEQILDQ